MTKKATGQSPRAVPVNDFLVALSFIFGQLRPVQSHITPAFLQSQPFILAKMRILYTLTLLKRRRRKSLSHIDKCIFWAARNAAMLFPPPQHFQGGKGMQTKELAASVLTFGEDVVTI